MPERPFDYCLCMQNGSVFADFGLNKQGQLYLLRISFDSYDVSRIDENTSSQLIKIFTENKYDTDYASEKLSAYFYENRHLIWEDALIENNILKVFN